MTTCLTSIISLAVGMVIGSFLPKITLWWQNARRPLTFKPVILKAYSPKPGSLSEVSCKGPSAS
ncbi:MAG: hypothetical protein PHI06_11090 [Desulfobulbaceae bacterium]|nr:hypothetical protein [Desulfobulbaceae bacterium]